MRLSSILFALCLSVSPLYAQGEVVDNASTLWNRESHGNAQIAVTRNQPKLGYAGWQKGSLEMSTTGNMNDWAFYRRGILPGETWGSLSDLTALSFEWFRQTGFNPPPGPSDWATKSPVFRVGLANGAELVWENWYNGNNTTTDAWVSSNLMAGNFWFHNNGAYSTVLSGPCDIGPMKVWDGTALALTIQQTIDCFGNASVSSVAVGVGSQWDYEYTGYVDNVVVAFNNNTVVNANFDFPFTSVPEPNTVYLMVAGLVGLLWINRRRIVTDK
jgi:hypothetical protein